MPKGVYDRHIKSVNERFWPKTEIGPVPTSLGLYSPCIIWKPTKSINYYGSIYSNGRIIKAHRWAYEQICGPVPENKELDHLCRTKSCVEWSHLEPVEHKENIRRAYPTKVHRIKGIWNKYKEECKRGHPFSGNNLYIYPNGDRACRTCARAKKESRT